jgi:CHAT domain-containing protein/tetratricopeptide (TPR) repeat protein
VMAVAADSTPRNPGQTGLSEEAARLSYLLAVGPAPEDAAHLEELAIRTAAQSAESGHHVDAGTLWTELGHRLLASPFPNAAEVNQALGYFGAAADRLRDEPGDFPAATLTWAQIGTAIAWRRMPFQGSDVVRENAMRAAREALSSCPPGVEWQEIQVRLLDLWGSLIVWDFGAAVSRDDCDRVRDNAVALLTRRPAPTGHAAYFAMFAHAAALLSLGETEEGTETLRRAERSATSLHDSFERARCLTLLANTLALRSSEATSTEAARLHLRAARLFRANGRASASASAYRAAGVILIGQQRWEEALRAFRRSVSEGEAVLEEALLLTQADDTIAILAETQHAIVLCLARLGRTGQAAVAADQARARRFRAFPRHFSPDLVRVRELRPDLAERFLRAHRRVRLAETEELGLWIDPDSATIEGGGALMDEMRLAKAEWYEVQDEIRSVPGLERSFSPTTLRRIRAAIPRGAVAAYVVSTPHGGVAVLVSRKTLTTLSLPMLTTTAVSERLGAVAEAYDGWRDLGDAGSQRRLEDAIEIAGKWLWEALMGTVLREAEEFERLIVLPGDGLDFLPLQAAWCANAEGGRVYALDVMPISLAPSAELQPARPATWLEGRMLMVAEPAPVAEQWGPLPAAHIEADAIRAGFRNAPLAGEAATKEAVVAGIPGAGAIHMACHGRAHFGLPYASFLLLAHDAELRVSDIVDLELDSRPFVFLSACETGAHDIHLAEEGQSLSGAFLSAGAIGVVSTLWQVFDPTALLITVAVYDELLKGNDPLSALRHAQLWIRDVPIEDKESRLKAMAWLPLAVKDAACQHLHAEGLDLSAPLNWAAHVYSGA